LPVEVTKSVSATFVEDAYYNTDHSPLPLQGEDERRRNVCMFFFRYGKLTESMLKVCYGEVDTLDKYKK
jgi:hypothetical protein